MTDEKRKTLHADISAKTLQAMTPMIRQIEQEKHSDYYFMNQVNTDFWGVYLIPLDKGCMVVAVDHCRILAVTDPQGRASCPMKVYFPDGLLEAAQTRKVTLENEGSATEVDAEPRPGFVHCTDGFAMLSVAHDRDTDKQLGSVMALLEADSEAYEILKQVRENLADRFPGVFGTWFNNDHGNVINLSSYRAAEADVDFIKSMIAAANTSETAAIPMSHVNPMLLSGFCHAADVLDTAISFRFSGQDKSIQIFSTNNDLLFGLLMPLKIDSVVPFDPTRHFLVSSASTGESDSLPS